MSDPASRAAAAATAQFKIEEPASNLDNYSVIVNELKDAFEVQFLPKQPPLQISESGKFVVIFGGRTEFGRFVRYLVAKDTYSIVRRTYAR
jgi:hypothetical protein